LPALNFGSTIVDCCRLPTGPVLVVRCLWHMASRWRIMAAPARLSPLLTFFFVG
jgi:hypothetical protein